MFVQQAGHPTCSTTLRFLRVSLRARQAVREIHWPASADPSPYEIFSLTPATFDKKKLNKAYIQLAKKYHPDAAGNDKVGAADCADKFKKLVAAHEILKDDHQRRMWDIRHGVGEYGFTSHTHASTGSYPAYCYRQPHGASTWQGQQPHRSYDSDPVDGFWSAENKAKFDNNLNDNRVWLFKVVCAFVFFIAACELTAMFEVSDRRKAELDRISSDTAAVYGRSLANFELGNSAEDRVRRFLDHRQRTMDNYPDTSYRGMTRGSTRRPADPKEVSSD